jgi:hypothetical protein
LAMERSITAGISSTFPMDFSYKVATWHYSRLVTIIQ